MFWNTKNTYLFGLNLILNYKNEKEMQPNIIIYPTVLLDPFECKICY